MTRYEPAIHLQDVSYLLDGRPILKHITGSFPKGKITTLVGPSGAGKTTLLKLCNGLASPTSGSILINNRKMETYPPATLRRLVGMALQSAPMIKGTVYENLNLPRSLHGETLSEQEAVNILGDVGLDARFLTHQATELSGGQRQKVSIARTLINQSNILLLDEITSALDRKSCHEIEQLIKKINRLYNVTIIWITHNLRQARNLGDFTWVLHDGQLLEAGESRILDESTDPVVLRFVKGDLE